MYGISLFSGIGGLELGLQEAAEIETVAYVEWEPYPQSVLIARLAEGWLPNAPIYDDIREFDGRGFNGVVDIVFGGFPCQDLSRAGKRAGIKEGNRSGLFHELLRVVDEVRPKFVFLENSAGIFDWFPVDEFPTSELVEGQERKVDEIQGHALVSGYFSEIGYGTKWLPVSAAEVGNMQKQRIRWFCLAYSNEFLRDEVQRRESDSKGSIDDSYVDCLRESQLPGDKQDERGRDNSRIEPSVFDDSEAARYGEDGRRVHAVTESEGLSGGVDAVMSDSLRGKRGGEKKVQRIEGFSWCEGIRSVEDLFKRPSIPKPLLRGNVDGIRNRLERTKCLGNAVVPAQAAEAWRRLTSRQKDKEGGNGRIRS